MNNIHFSLDSKTTREKRKQKNFLDLKIAIKLVVN
jgi:hypothetical protein